MSTIIYMCICAGRFHKDPVRYRPNAAYSRAKILAHIAKQELKLAHPSPSPCPGPTLCLSPVLDLVVALALALWPCAFKLSLILL